MDGEVVLVCRVADLRCAVLAAGVTRVHGAAQFVPVDGLGAGVVGIVNVAGEHLALLSTARVLGLAQGGLTESQRFIEVLGRTRWLLWVDEVMGVLPATAGQLEALRTAPNAPVKGLLRLSDESLGVLDLDVLEPDAVVGA